MGRKSKSQKINATANKAKNPDPMLETKIKDLIKDSEPRVPKPVVSNEKKQSNEKSINVRRSGRLRSLARPFKYQEVDCQIQEINFVESERDEDEPPVEDYVETPMIESHEIENEEHNDDSNNENTESQMSLEKKVNDLIVAVEELKSKGRNGHILGDNTSANFNYRSLYFDSQKKNMALISEKNELSRKLEIALAKLQVYEDMDKCSVKLMIPNMPKDTGAVVQLASHVDQISSPVVKPTSHVDQIPSPVVKPTPRVDQIPSPVVKPTPRVDQISSPVVKPTSRVDQDSSPVVKRSSRVDQNSSPSVKRTSRVDQISSPVVKRTSRVDQISSPDDVEPKKLSAKKRRRDKTGN